MGVGMSDGPALEQTWESNRAVRLENVGRTDVINPWLSNGRNGFRKYCALREEAISRVNGLRARLRRGGDDRIAIEVALARRWRPETPRVVAGGHVHGTDVGIRVDRDRANAHAPSGTRDATRDLATIRDQDPLKHRLAFPTVIHGSHSHLQTSGQSVR